MRLKISGSLRYRAAIDLTALIDLVFLLVAFFMVTSSIDSLSSISIDLPSSRQSGLILDRKNVISIDSQNRIFINSRPAARETLDRELEGLDGETLALPFVIEGDKTSNYEMIVYVMDSLSRAGISRFTLSTKK